MKALVAGIILISFIVISVFGYTSVHYSGQHKTVRCITEQIGGAQCPDARNPFSLADFHIGALKIFSLAVAGEKAAGFISGLAILLASMLFTALGVVFLFVPQISAFFLRGLSISSPAYSRLKLINWLALHENSPTFSWRGQKIA